MGTRTIVGPAVPTFWHEITSSAAVPEMVLWVAVMVVLPPPTLVARPSLPETLEMVATETLVEDQVAEAVRSRVELSE